MLDVRITALGVQYEHALQDQTADHEPVPVIPPPGWHEGRCDFCNADHPAWELPVRDFTVPGLASHSSAGSWAACDRCASLIRAGNWKALERQAMRRMIELGGDRTGYTLIRMLYKQVRKNVSGPLRHISCG